MKRKQILASIGIPLGIFLLVCLFSGVMGNIADDVIVQSKYANNQTILSDEEKYQRGIEFIKQGMWNEATDALRLAMVMDYKDGKVLYYYADAKKKELEEDYFIANYLCREYIPDYYMGEMATEIAAFKKEIAVKSDQQLERESKAAAEQKQADLAAHKVWIGMTKAEAEISQGKPYDINRTVTSYGTHEQWCYNGGVYLYFETED
jgi:hypothetical protein